MVSKADPSARSHFDCETTEALGQHHFSQSKNSVLSRRVVSGLFTVSLGAALAIVCLFMSEAPASERAISADGVTKYDLRCIKNRLSEYDGNLGPVAGCELTFSPLLEEWVASPFASGDALSSATFVPTVLLRPQTHEDQVQPIQSFKPELQRTGGPVSMRTPATLSGRKAVRVNQRNREYNRMYKSEMKTRIKSVQESVEKADYKGAAEQLAKAFQIIDKNTKRGILHKNTAARRKSQIHRLVKKLEDGGVVPENELNALSEGDDDMPVVLNEPEAGDGASAFEFANFFAAQPLARMTPSQAAASPVFSRNAAPSMISHGKKFRKLNKPADQRKALLRALTTETVRHGRIRSTLARCKETRKTVDHMITLAKGGSLHERRQALGYIYDKQLVHALFTSAPDRYADRAGGYTRVLRDGYRRGDNSEMGIIELL